MKDSISRIARKEKITLKQLIAGAFALTTVVAGATFTLTKWGSENYVQTLKERIVELEKENDHLKKRPMEQEGNLPDQQSGNELVVATSQKVPSEIVSSITFKQPKNNAQVSQFIDIEYTVAGTLPTGYRAILLVRDPLGQYWSWGSSVSGRHVRVQIGVAEDTGRQFEIGVLVTNQQIPLGQPMLTLPKGITYKSISVRRK